VVSIVKSCTLFSKVYDKFVRGAWPGQTLEARDALVMVLRMLVRCCARLASKASSVVNCTMAFAMLVLVMTRLVAIWHGSCVHAPAACAVSKA